MGTRPNTRGKVWHCTEHLALWVYHGHFLWACLGCAASKVCHLIFRCCIINEHCDVICDVIAPHCIGHMTFYYKRSADASVGGVLACGSSVHQVQLYHQRPVCGWCLTRVGHDTSSASPGWSLLPSNVIIVLALVNSAVSPAGVLGISMRPGSVASLPVSTASTGLLCLLVGAHVHRVKSKTEVGVWLLLCTYHIQCMTYTHYPSAAQLTIRKGNFQPVCTHTD